MSYPQQHLPHLRELQIKDNPLGDEGLSALAHALRDEKLLPSLSKLLVRDNGEAEGGEAAAALAAACEARKVTLSRDKTKLEKGWKEKQGQRDAELRDSLETLSTKKLRGVTEKLRERSASRSKSSSEGRKTPSALSQVVESLVEHSAKPAAAESDLTA